MLDDKEKEYFNKQLDGFIREVQERFHLTYEEALREIFNRALDSLFRKRKKIFTNKEL